MAHTLIIIVAIAAAVFTLRRGVPGLLVWKGYSHQDRGRYETAEQYFLKALSFEKAIQRMTGQKLGVALVCSSLGLLYHRQRRIEEAAKMLTTSIAIYADLGRIDDSAPVHGSLGKLYFDTGDLALAEKSLNEALEIYRRRPEAHEAIATTQNLLHAVDERRRPYPDQRKDGGAQEAPANKITPADSVPAAAELFVGPTQ